MDSFTNVVLLTPPGRGAVASLRVEGPAALDVVDRCLDSTGARPLRELPSAAIALRRWRAAPATGEQVVVALLDPQCIEVHGHGGTAVCEALIVSLVAKGCRRREWRELTCEGAKLLEAEARGALADAATERVAGILLDQLRGALRDEVRTIIERIDAAELWSALERLAVLVDRASLGLRLTQPWRVVLAGRPNVGKSSLANALLGYDRAIVMDQPGTTRDVLSAATAIDGWPVELFDTAGLRAGGDAIETAGMAKARARILAADVSLVVADVSQPWTGEDDELLATVVHPLLVHNKSDLAPASAEDGRPRGLATSALTGAGVPQLIEAISKQLVPAPPPPGMAVPFTERQLSLLKSAAESLQAQDLQLARRRLAEL